MSTSEQQEREDPAKPEEAAEENGSAPVAEEGVVEFDERRAKMERMREEGIDPYPPVTLWGRRRRIGTGKTGGATPAERNNRRGGDSA